jgi:hypothetical protein
MGPLPRISGYGYEIPGTAGEKPSLASPRLGFRFGAAFS